jgi:hypothetical protein
MITFQSTYVYQTAPRERPSPVLCMAAIGILSHGWFFVDGPPAHLRCYTRADEIAPTMIAADAPYDDVILSPQFTRCFIIVLSRCKCKVGTKNVVLMKLWHGEFSLQNVPSQHETSPSHNFFNIGPLSSIFGAKLYSICRSTDIRPRRVGKKRERIAALYCGMMQNQLCRSS